MKNCSKCGELKSFNEFNKRSNSIDGLRPDCKSCRKVESKKYRDENKEYIKEYHSKYYQNNKQHLKEYYFSWYKENSMSLIKYQKEYRENNKDIIRNKKREYVFNKRNSDPEYKLRMNIRCRMKNAFKKKSWKINGSIKLLGEDISFVKNYIEDKFLPGMNWDNYGEWHIDHIIPLASANTKKEIENLCHYTNLQPLWAVDNLKKGSFIDGKVR